MNQEICRFCISDQKRVASYICPDCKARICFMCYVNRTDQCSVCWGVERSRASAWGKLSSLPWVCLG